MVWGVRSSIVKNKKTKTDPETLKAKVEAIKEEKRMKLTAVARCWGSAEWIWPGTQSLWQIQVQHCAWDTSLGQGSFRKSLVDTARRALLRHPAFPKICDLKSLFKEGRIKILNGAPPQEARVNPSSVDPDGLGLSPWEPVLYAAGDTPFEALTVIRLVMEDKVQGGLLSRLPALHLVWALLPDQEAPKESLPELWTAISVTVPRSEPNCLAQPNPFAVLPPLGRRHVLGHLQIAAKNKKIKTCDVPLYDFKIFGGIYYFKDGFDSLKIPLAKMEVPTNGDKEYVRILYDLQVGDHTRCFIQKVLQEVLHNLPMLLINDIPNEDDDFACWLLDQPSVILRRTEESLLEELEERRAMAKMKQQEANQAIEADAESGGATEACSL
eukprot:s2508_g8.t1